MIGSHHMRALLLFLLLYGLSPSSFFLGELCSHSPPPVLLPFATHDIFQKLIISW